MSKKSLLEREKKRKYLFKKYLKKREILKDILKYDNSYIKKRNAYYKLQLLPRNSNVTRKRNRCLITGKPRGYFRFFGLSRIEVRKKILNCEIPGFFKSSW